MKPIENRPLHSARLSNLDISFDIDGRLCISAMCSINLRAADGSDDTGPGANLFIGEVFSANAGIEEIQKTLFAKAIVVAKRLGTFTVSDIDAMHQKSLEEERERNKVLGTTKDSYE